MKRRKITTRSCARSQRSLYSPSLAPLDKELTQLCCSFLDTASLGSLACSSQFLRTVVRNLQRWPDWIILDVWGKFKPPMWVQMIASSVIIRKSRTGYSRCKFVPGATPYCIRIESMKLTLALAVQPECRYLSLVGCTVLNSEFFHYVQPNLQILEILNTPSLDTIFDGQAVKAWLFKERFPQLSTLVISGGVDTVWCTPSELSKFEVKSLRIAVRGSLDGMVPNSHIEELAFEQSSNEFTPELAAAIPKMFPRLQLFYHGNCPHDTYTWIKENQGDYLASDIEYVLNVLTDN